MSTLKFSFIFSIFLFLFHSSTQLCFKKYCGKPNSGLHFEFPFILREDYQNNNNQTDRCGYPGFEIYCNHSKQALLKLPNDKNFVVKSISLERQRIWVKGPNDCPPQRFIENINFNYDSPFIWDNSFHSNYENVTFLNCSTNSSKEPNPMIDELPTIPCMSNANYTIMYTLQSSLVEKLNSTCHKIGFAEVPVRDDSQEPVVIMDGLYSNAMLRWNTPSCGCEPDQSCGFLNDTGLDVTCYSKVINFPVGNPSTQRHKKFNFFPVLWGVLGVLFFMWWVFLSIYNDRQQNHIQQRETITNIEPSNQEPPWFVFGLDRSMIEQYPKIQLAESGQLPKSIDKLCSICLCEYKPMETLRSIPQCNHHFHVDCIDVWLKMNATCPLCRNLPGL
ncbi:putative RING-H2 finger protein ATL21A [Vicia villosa]|uniref:putative RING-H2 finger protein ATL21A n=1 Tax=Vicia villosa TaxID=3911 RepID=UPI00273CD329|nr:putative RING-H2 finger protein ATL21A [Vicia villosa]